MTRRRMMIVFLVGGCGGGAAAPDAAPDPPDADVVDPSWFPASWPTTLPDPAAAGERVLALLDGRWELDLTAAPPDAPCEALDCPGPADGWDPSLSAAGEGDWDVRRYVATVHAPTRLWRELDTSKHVVRVGDTLAIGMGEVTTFYRRALDGGLLVVRPSTDPMLDGPDDFWRAAFADHGDRIQIVTSDPLGNGVGLRVEVQTAPEAIVIGGEVFSFRALRTTADLDESLPPAYAELAGDPAPARAIELIDQAFAAQDADRGLVAQILWHTSHADPAVRAAAVRYALASYDWWWNKVERVIIADQLIARLLQDPEASIRAQVASGFETMWTTVPDRYYHCAIDWAVHQCATGDTDAGVAAACQAVVDLGRTPYGYCPWLAPD